MGAIDNENFAKIVSKFELDTSETVDLNNPVLRDLALHCSVFARMNPEQKALIVKIMKTYFKEFEVTVGFCGDGANDCIALKEADIGISLSKTEASLSAPFISGIEDISCVEIISQEGKAALTTNFDCFRYFCLYSIIQTIGLIFLFGLDTEYTDGVYITCDIFIALNLANCMGLLRPVRKLTSKMPFSSLFNKELIISIFWNCLMAFGFIIGGLYVIHLDKGYKDPKTIYDEHGAAED